MPGEKLIKEAEQIIARASWIGTYILNGEMPEPCYKTLEWARWMETADRRVARTETNNGTVSTVFLGISYNFWSKRQPLLFETIEEGYEKLLNTNQDRGRRLYCVYAVHRLGINLRRPRQKASDHSCGRVDGSHIKRGRFQLAETRGRKRL